MDYGDADLIARLRGALADSAPLRLVVLFGSRATGGATPASDVDVGILPRDARLSLGDELALAHRLSGATGTEVDVVRLDDASPILEREIARDGVCVYEAEPGGFAAWRASAMSRWIDFEEIIAPTSLSSPGSSRRSRITSSGSGAVAPKTSRHSSAISSSCMDRLVPDRSRPVLPEHVDGVERHVRGAGVPRARSGA